MSIVTPALFTSTNINVDQKVRDMSSSIAFLSPRFAQILLLASRVAPAPFDQAFGQGEAGAMPISLGIRTVTNFKYEWLEDAVKSTSTTINKVGDYTSGDVSLVVTDASIFQINDIVDAVATQELLMVTSVNTSTNTIIVTRAWGSIAAAAILNGATLLIIGNAFSEAASYQLAPQRITSTKYNLIQDTRHAFSGTYVLDHHELYNGDQRSYLRNKSLVDHQRYIEASLLFGQLKDGTSGLSDGSPKKSTQGLFSRLTSNNLAVGGTLTKQVWNNWLRDLFEYGSSEKVIMCSKVVAGAVNNFVGDASGAAPTSQIFVMNNAKSFGLNIMSYQTKFGLVHLVIHGMLTGSIFSGYAVGIDPAHLQMCKVRNGFFMSLREDTVQDGAHRWVDEYATYFGLQYTNPETGGVLTGVTG